MNRWKKRQFEEFFTEERKRSEQMTLIGEKGTGFILLYKCGQRAVQENALKTWEGIFPPRRFVNIYPRKWMEMRMRKPALDFSSLASFGYLFAWFGWESPGPSLALLTLCTYTVDSTFNELGYHKISEFLNINFFITNLF